MDRFRVLEDVEALSRAAAEEVVAAAAEAVRARNLFTVALAGGHTPRRLYELLGDTFRSAVAWNRTHLFWGDERCVPPGHPDSNYRLTRIALLDRVPVPPGAVHRIRGELEPERAAAEYDAELAQYFGRSAPAPPTFDLVLLGLGADGHTASLFPGQVEPHDTRWARAVTAPPGVEPERRVTLTLRALTAARRALFLVAGAEKAKALERVRRALAAAGGVEPVDEKAPPSARVRAQSEVVWLVDRAAAG